MRGGGEEKEGEKESQADSGLSAQSPMWGSISGTKPFDHDLSPN